MLKTIYQGDKWAALTCTYAGMREMEQDMGGGTSITGPVYCYVLQCECGSEPLVIPRSQFRGKRAIKDCGCGAALYGSSSMMSFTTPVGVRGMIAAIADHEKTNLSQAVTMLVRWGIERWLKQNKIDQDKVDDLRLRKPKKAEDQSNDETGTWEH
jgi:hypothetical protein